ncbi:MAG: hypothetical protein NVS3B10_24930 [Polyangiales bacterium]
MQTSGVEGRRVTPRKASPARFDGARATITQSILATGAMRVTHDNLDLRA